MVFQEKVYSIRETWTKLYFNKILRRLSPEDLENANIISDYII